MAKFYFTITYRPGKENEKADILTRREQDVRTQDALKHTYRTQVLLPLTNVDPRIIEELDQAREARDATSISVLDTTQVAPISPLAEELSSLHLMDKLIAANKTHPSLDKERDAARRGDEGWLLKEGLLTFQKRLVIPLEETDLRTKLIQEIHCPVTTAHPGKNKTIQLVGRQYY